MRVVNLAKRPFVNRRPIVRLAVLLWIFGTAMLGVNAMLYSEHWQGTAENRRRIAEVDDALKSQLETLETLDQELDQVRFRSRNRQAAFLNSIVARRAFPWSALFDHLERVMPDDIRLVAVQPDVYMAEQDDDNDQSSKDEPPPSDAVMLSISGWAKSEPALTTFLDTLYQDPAFGNPFLQGEQLDRDGNAQAVRFNLNVLFFTRPAQEEVEEGEEVEELEDEAILAEDAPPTEEGLTVGEPATAEDDSTEEASQLARTTPPAVQPRAVTPAARPEGRSDGEPPSASRRVAPRPRTSGEPPRSRDARGNAREEAEAARNRNISRQSGAPPSNRRTPSSNRADLRQRLQELQARSRARSENRDGRPDTNNVRPEDTGPGEDETPTRTKPPASSTPRLDGITQTPTSLWSTERLEDRA